MIARLQSKIFFTGILSFIIVALIAALAIPALAASPPNPVAQLKTHRASVQGTIAAISGNVITVKAGKGGSQVTLTLDGNTNLSLHGVTALAVGQTVTVVYNSRTLVADTVIENAGNHPDRNNQSITGTLTTVAGNTITIKPLKGGNPINLTLSGNTHYSLRGVTGLASGQIVSAVYDSQTLGAEMIMVVMSVPSPVMSAPEPANTPTTQPSRVTIPPSVQNNRGIAGTLTTISNNTITVTPRKGGSRVTLTRDSNTEISLRGISGLATGQDVTAVYNSQTLVAVKVSQNAMPPPDRNNQGLNQNANKSVRGTIKAISGGTITIVLQKGGSQVNLTLDSNTSFSLRGVSGLAVGQTVTAVFDSRTLAAKAVMMSLQKPAGTTIGIGSTVIPIPDPNLYTALCEAIGKPEPPGGIEQADLEGLTWLSAFHRGISNLSGLEYCINLFTLGLSFNQISDISSLSTLIRLNFLYLDFNQISDISPLSTLTSLHYLYLDYNQISDISPLSALTGLNYLFLSFNQINDISPLSTLAGLYQLDLAFNQISDIPYLSTLTSLNRLHLGWNQISDISPLSALTGLNYLFLSDNQISDISPLSTLTRLSYLYLDLNHINDISPLSTWTNLIGLNLSSNRISDISLLSTLTNLNWLALSSNEISDISPLSALTNLNYLFLDWNQIKNVSPLSTLANLHYLELSVNQISTITPLSTMINLQSLYLSWNQISDISPLSTLTDLVAQGLSAVRISDISPLSTLTSLKNLELSYNQICDISPLATLTSLEYLYLGFNQIRNLSLVSTWSHLLGLDLSGNRISDTSLLSALTNLNFLNLSMNQISDITPLSTLTNLNSLYLYNNQISDIFPLSALTHLTILSLENNQISDISPLSTLTNLNYLYLNWNQIKNISPFSDITNLYTLDLTYNYLDISSGSPTMLIIAHLISHGTQVIYLSQLADLCPKDYRWSTLHTPAYKWDPYPKIFKSSQQVRLVNIRGSIARNVTATITCKPANVTILSGTVHFGDIPAGGSAWSTDDFSLAIDMTYKPLPPPNKGIIWRIEYIDTAGALQVIDNVPQFCGKAISCP